MTRGKRAARPRDDLGSGDFPHAVSAVLRRLSRAFQGPAQTALESAVAWVGGQLSAEERDAWEAAGRLGGVAGVLPLVELRFGFGVGWIPFEYVRLREPREVYALIAYDVTFTRRRPGGWCRVSRGLALACAEVNADGRSLVFDLSVERPEGRVVDLGK